MRTTETSRAGSLADELRAAVHRGDVGLPPLPDLVAKLQELLRRDDGADPAFVAKLVRNEPAIAASVLRMANSAAFGGLREIYELDRAIMRLGLRQVTSIVTTVVQRGYFHTHDENRIGLLRALWDHSVATAIASQRLTLAAGEDAEEAYLAGLLHDTGKLLVLRGVDHVERYGDAGAVTPAVVEELMEVLHPELGFEVLTSWRIPERICRVAGLHHHDDVPAEESLVLRVQAANAIAKKTGFHPKPQLDLALLDVSAIARLDLSDLEVAALMVDLEDAVQEIRSLL